MPLARTTLTIVLPNSCSDSRNETAKSSRTSTQASQIFGSTFAPSTSLTGTKASLAPYPGLPTGIVLVPFTGLGNGVIRLPNFVGTTTVANPFHRGYAESYNLIVQHEFFGWVAE